MSSMHVLFSQQQISARVGSLATEIVSQWPACQAEDGIVMVGPLKGAVVFMADLARALSSLGVRVDLAFMKLSSYGAGTVSSGSVTMEHAVDMDVSARHVLLIDDIIDTGRTLDFARRELDRAGPASTFIVSFLDKPSRRVVEVPVDLVGFTIEDVFVLGYGTDLDQRYRELPYVGVRR